MKRLILYLLLLAICWPHATANKLWVNPFDIKAGETKAIDIYLTMDSGEPYVGFHFDLHLPDGLEVEGASSGNPSFVLQANRTESNNGSFGWCHSLTSNYADGYYTIIVSSDTNASLKGSDGAVITMYVKASKDVHVDKLTASVSDIKLGRITETSDNFASEPFEIITTKEIRLKLDANGYSTYACDNNFRMISGASAYTGEYSSGNVNLYDINDDVVIPAGEGVMLLGGKGENVVILATGEDADAVQNNDFVGVTHQTTSLKAGNNYVFTPIDDYYIFAPAAISESVNTLMNKAYINTQDERPEYVTLNGSTPDRIPNLSGDVLGKEATIKYLKNKNVWIRNKDGIYTVGGTRTEHP